MTSKNPSNPEKKRSVDLPDLRNFLERRLRSLQRQTGNECSFLSALECPQFPLLSCDHMTEPAIDRAAAREKARRSNKAVVHVTWIQNGDHFWGKQALKKEGHYYYQFKISQGHQTIFIELEQRDVGKKNNLAMICVLEETRLFLLNLRKKRIQNTFPHNNCSCRVGMPKKIWIHFYPIHVCHVGISTSHQNLFDSTKFWKTGKTSLIRRNSEEKFKFRWFDEILKESLNFVDSTKFF